MKKGYVNFIEIERVLGLSPNTIIKAFESDMMEALVDKRLLKIRDVRSIDTDRYMIPVYVHAVLISDPNTIYMVDQAVATKQDRIDLLGGQITEYYFKCSRSYLMSQLITNGCRQLTRSGQPSMFTDRFEHQFSSWFTALNKRPISFRSMYYNNDGLYLIAPVVVSPAVNRSFLLPYSRDTHRLFVNMKAKNKLTLSAMQSELQCDAEYDCRYHKFDLITSIFDMIRHN